MAESNVLLVCPPPADWVDGKNFMPGIFLASGNCCANESRSCVGNWVPWACRAIAGTKLLNKFCPTWPAFPDGVKMPLPPARFIPGMLCIELINDSVTLFRWIIKSLRRVPFRSGGEAHLISGWPGTNVRTLFCTSQSMNQSNWSSQRNSLPAKWICLIKFWIWEIYHCLLNFRSNVLKLILNPYIQ